MSDDELHGKILTGVRSIINAQPAIWGYGPISDVRLPPRKANCFVLVDEDNEPNLDAEIDVSVDGQIWKITINKKKKKQYKVKLHGPEFSRRDLLKGALATGAIAANGFHPALSADVVIDGPPVPLTGTLMGGDAIFNTKYRDAISAPDDVYWGTIAYVSSASGTMSLPGGAVVPQPVPRSCVSCAHVLYHEAGGGIETTNHTSGFSSPVTLTGWPSNWPTSSPTGGIWPDLAATVADGTITVKEKEVRGLGQLQGVEAPVFRDIVAKYGATTGLTVARDNGVVWRRLPDQTGAFFMVRSLAMQFSRPGDSGAAVVFAGSSSGTKYGKLAGFVLAGSTADDEQFYLPARPVVGTPPVPPELSIVQIDL